MRKKLRNKFTWILVGWLLFVVPRSVKAQFPFACDALTENGDLSAIMVKGIDSFLTRQTKKLKQDRAKLWHYDFSSLQGFDKATRTNRNLLALRLGVADKRSAASFEILTNNSLKQFAVDAGESMVYAVRWRVFDDLWAEGLLVQPKGKVSARIVMIPDADTEPEVLAGFINRKGATWGAARQMANNGCQVVIPVMVNRTCDFSGSEIFSLFTNQPHREWLYRQSYEVGRHVIGYELQKIFAVIDWFEHQNKRDGVELPFGIAGYAEGGMLALYAAAIDRRVSSTIVSGYFDEREELWREPIYRNVFGRLTTFGDAELAIMAWPNSVIVEYSAGPEINGPPQVTSTRSGAAPGQLKFINRSTAFAEWQRARSIVPGSKNNLYWIQGKSQFVDHPFSFNARSLFAQKLRLEKKRPGISSIKGVNSSNWVSSLDRQKKTVRDIERNVQRTLQFCSLERDANFWQTLKGDSAEQASIKTAHRKKLGEVLGFLSPSLSTSRPKARVIKETDKWTSYEITLDVLPEVFAWGILMVPKNMARGEKRPVVVCQHGLESVPNDAVTTDSTAENYHFYKGFATQLTERGYITFSPHNPYRGQDKFRVLQRKANPIGLTIFSIITAQHQRIVDWLASQSFVDAARIGFYGLSYGGKTAMRVPALVKGYALSICSGDFNEWVLKNATTSYNFSYLFTNEYEMPEWDLGHSFNYAEMAALIAPRPFMVERGIYDGVATDEWVDFEFAKVRRHYLGLGLSHLCAIEHFAGPHTINGVGTFSFLDKYLNRNWSPDK
jgi:dienelactone hydrolase